MHTVTGASSFSWMVTALAVIFALTNLGCVVSAQPLPGGLAKDLHRRDPPPGPVPEGWQKKIDDIFEQCCEKAVAGGQQAYWAVIDCTVSTYTDSGYKVSPARKDAVRKRLTKPTDVNPEDSPTVRALSDFFKGDRGPLSEREKQEEAIARELLRLFPQEGAGGQSQENGRSPLPFAVKMPSKQELFRSVHDGFTSIFSPRTGAGARRPRVLLGPR